MVRNLIAINLNAMDGCYAGGGGEGVVIVLTT